ncbi:MAG: hypothetical protein QMB63_00615 [Clostridiaceae bacterium]
MNKNINEDKKEKGQVSRKDRREFLGRVAAIFMVVILLSGIAASALSLF